MYGNYISKDYVLLLMKSLFSSVLILPSLMNK